MVLWGAGLRCSLDRYDNSYGRFARVLASAQTPLGASCVRRTPRNANRLTDAKRAWSAAAVTATKFRGSEQVTIYRTAHRNDATYLIDSGSDHGEVEPLVASNVSVKDLSYVQAKAHRPVTGLPSLWRRALNSAPFRFTARAARSVQAAASGVRKIASTPSPISLRTSQCWPEIRTISCMPAGCRYDDDALGFQILDHLGAPPGSRFLRRASA